MRLSELTFRQAFRYVGSKIKLFKKCDFDIPECTHVIEPFMGSACFSLSMDKPWIGFDSKPDLVAMFNWLKTVPESRLRELKQYEGTSFSIKDLPLSNEEKSYLRVNISGVYVGQMGSWKIYRQHKLPVEQTITALPMIRKGVILCRDFKESLRWTLPTSLVFVDPPYLGTDANYGVKHKEFNPEELIDYLNRLTNAGVNWIFTYGTEAPELFPDYEWNLVYGYSVPRIHSKTKGSLKRIEHIAFNYNANFVRL